MEAFVGKGGEEAMGVVSGLMIEVLCFFVFFKPGVRRVKMGKKGVQYILSFRTT